MNNKPIKIEKTTREELKKLKTYTKQSYDEVINKLCEKEENYIDTITSFEKEFEFTVGSSSRVFKVIFKPNGLGEIQFYHHQKHYWAKTISVWNLYEYDEEKQMENTLIKEYFERFIQMDNVFSILKNMGKMMQYDGFDIREVG